MDTKWEGETSEERELVQERRVWECCVYPCHTEWRIEEKDDGKNQEFKGQIEGCREEQHNNEETISESKAG